MTDKTDAKIARLEAQVSEMAGKTQRVYDAIYGNGKPGLITELQLLRQSVEDHHKGVEELKRRTHGDWKWVITTIIAIAALVSMWMVRTA